MKSVLIEALDKTCHNRGVPPKTDRKNPTIAMVQYDVLSNNPYKYDKKTFYEEVYLNRLGKKSLKLSRYSLYRNELRKKWGWGIHINEDGKIALIGCETDEYKRLRK